jgi:hypothetical protein
VLHSRRGKYDTFYPTLWTPDFLRENEWLLGHMIDLAVVVVVVVNISEGFLEGP